ncbi:ComEC/Rec2 family competence protein [Sphingomonas sp.]|uniref:ComEC/Rec2 family competence protein n=1 Tax=Sphingomonas sp. TaxID=28214 RepID=UPI0025FE79B8|nr:ComEC/Rec2 family competence protein [Sphingomonas sp.]
MDAVFDSAPSTLPETRQSGLLTRLNSKIEAAIDTQRDQLPLWLPVMLGCGIAAWFVLSERSDWIAWIAAMFGLAAASLMAPRHGRFRRLMIIAPLTCALGCGLAWLRSETVAAPVLSRPSIATFSARVERIDVQVTKDRLRLTLLPIAAPELPPRVRVNVDVANAPPRLVVGERIRIRARLMGPQPASVPGGYDFSRAAWFMELGATGKSLGPVVREGSEPTRAQGFRDRLSAHIKTRVEGSAGGIAAAFATGDRGGIATADEDAMRASGLTHLLSISGLHVTAVVGAVMLLTLRLMALSTRLALRLPLIVIAAGAGASAGIGYTLLTGAEIPTIRSCVAAVLIVIGGALGRQAFTLRLVAGGALAVLLVWPESLIGPSFQLSFAAITSLVALHEWVPVQRLVAGRDESIFLKVGRGMLSLLLTGIAVEVALAPIALFHFHRQGLYGALANIVAIPLTTFVTMPCEALAIMFDTVGLGAPFWWLTGLSLNLLLGIARHVAAWPGALAALASVPTTAFAMMLGGALWVILWRGRVRALGFVPLLAGAVWSLAIPPPDLLVTGDGKHLAVRSDGGRLATLRTRAGDYVRSTLAERAGELGELGDLDTLPGAVCSDDVCRVTLMRDGRVWRIVATRSRFILPIEAFVAECAAADIVISDRRLPRTCKPKWLKADRPMLEQTGGLAINFASRTVAAVSVVGDDHPWVVAQRAAVGAERVKYLREVSRRTSDNVAN